MQATGEIADEQADDDGDQEPRDHEGWGRLLPGPRVLEDYPGTHSLDNSDNPGKSALAYTRSRDNEGLQTTQ